MCEICGQLFGHDPRCPDYDSRDGAVYICQKCGDGIHGGEKILEYDGKITCSDCVDNLSHEELLELVGVPMRTVDAGIKLVILIEHGGKIHSLEDVKEWNNPRLKENPYAWDGVRMHTEIRRYEKLYGTEFQFCSKTETGRRILEILGGAQ